MERNARSFKDLLENSPRDAKEARARATNAVSIAKRLSHFANVMRGFTRRHGEEKAAQTLSNPTFTAECGTCLTNKPVIKVGAKTYMVCNRCERAEKVRRTKGGKRKSAPSPQRAGHQVGRRSDLAAQIDAVESQGGSFFS